MPGGDDTQRILGQLLASGDALKGHLVRIEAKVDRLACDHSETRDLVLAGATAMRVVRWTLGVVVAGLGFLGFDWWNR